MSEGVKHDVDVSIDWGDVSLPAQRRDLVIFESSIGVVSEEVKHDVDVSIDWRDVSIPVLHKAQQDVSFRCYCTQFRNVKALAAVHWEREKIGELPTGRVNQLKLKKKKTRQISGVRADFPVVVVVVTCASPGLSQGGS